MSKSPWGTIGAWAAEAEREEAEEREAAAKAAADAALAGVPLGGVSSFPSLKESVNTKPKKKTTMTLNEFRMRSADAVASTRGRGLTPEEMMRLPTGPKERSLEEMQYGRLGGGFSNYGSRPGPGGSGPGMGRERDLESSRRSYGFEDDNPRGRNQSRVSEFSQYQQPSRADGVDSWGSMKKSLPDYNSGMPHSGGNYSSLGGNTGVGGSRADEVDNWASGKKSFSRPQQHQSTRSSSFGSGVSRPQPKAERWTRNEGQRLVMESPRNEVGALVKANKPNPFGVARPREEVLAEKGLDSKKMEMDLEEKKQQPSTNGSRPTSSHSSRPGSSHSSRSEVPTSPGMAQVVGKQKLKMNPFGDAKPREVILEGKGLDWKKIDLDLDHRRVERSQTEEEKNLKEEIERLNKELLQKSGEDQTVANEVIVGKQQELYILRCRMDDNVRYSQNVSERHGFGDNRSNGFRDRPPSRPGSGYHDRHSTMPREFEEHRSGYPERRHLQHGMYEDPRVGFPERGPIHPSAYEYPQPGSSERPHSRSGGHEYPRVGIPHPSSSSSATYQGSRIMDRAERPRSQARSGDDRKSFHGGGGGGRVFIGNRDMNRSGSKW